jgi:hypothetical protein
MSYAMAGENKVSLSHSGRMSGQRVVRPLRHEGPYVWS